MKNAKPEPTRGRGRRSTEERDADAGAAEKGADTNKATVRVLEVLSAFASHTDSFGVTELAALLGMSKNMAFRALSTLVDQGYLIRTPAGRYELGLRVVELLNPNQPTPDLRELTLPFMHRLHLLSGETVRLGVMSYALLVIIDGIEPQAPVVSRVALGATFPLHLGPMARAALAALPDEAIERYIEGNEPLRGVTPNSITSAEQLRADVRKIRADGFARGLGDLSPGLVSVAFPIMDSRQRVWGAIGLGGPANRFPPEKLEAQLPEIRAIVDEMSAVTRLYTADVPTL